MKKMVCIAAAAVLCFLSFALRAEADIINFDDLASADNMVNPYAGVTWTHWKPWIEAFDPYVAHSNPTVLRTSYVDDSNLMEWASPINFQGAWFSGATGHAPWLETVTVQFEGFLNGASIGTSGLMITSNIPTLLSANFAGNVDSVRVCSNNAEYFVMDDVTFSKPVPEPISATLFLLGGGAMGLRIFRRKKA